MKNNKFDIDEIKEAVESTARSLSPAIAAHTVVSRLDASYFVFRKSNLPKVYEGVGKRIRTDIIDSTKDEDADHHLVLARHHLALAYKLTKIKEDEERSAAALKAHRDRIYKRLYPTSSSDVGYDQSLKCVQTAIDEIVKLETEIDMKKHRL